MKAMLMPVVAMLLLAVPAVAAPVGHPPQLVAGSGSYVGAGEGLSSFTVGTALSPGDGGQFRIDAHGFFTGMLDTTCLSFVGSRAVLIGALREPVEAFGQSWSYAGLYVEDNGNGRAGPADRVTAFVAFGPHPCDFLFEFGEQFAQPLVSGNVVVKDGAN